MVKSFAKLIVEIREQYGYSQRDLAEEIGTARSTVSGWEIDEKNPSRTYVKKLAQHFPDYEERLYMAARLLPLNPKEIDDIKLEFGNLLQEIRTQRNYRQSDLAERIGANKGTVCEWETGKRLPFRTRIEDLAAAFPKHKERIYHAARMLPQGE